MKITESQVRKLTLTDIDSLDPVSVFLEDFGVGQGRVTIECFGDAWSYYWGAMGDSNLIEFLKDANADYISNKLFNGQKRVVDYDKIATDINEEWVDEMTLQDHEAKLVEYYGEDWMFDLPSSLNHHYEYVVMIVNAVKEALGKIK